MIKLKIGMKFLSIAVFEGVRLQNNIYIKNVEPYTYIILILNPLAINPLMNSLHEKLASCRFRQEAFVKLCRSLQVMNFTQK